MPARNYSVDRLAMKALVAVYGPSEAARQAGIPINTVLSWSKRYKWKKAAFIPHSLAKSDPRSPLTGKDAGDALRESLEKSRINSTLHLAKYTERASQKAAKSKEPLEIARAVKDVAGVYRTLYPPEDGSELIEGSILIGAAKVTDNPEEIMAHVREELPDQRPEGD